MKEIKISITIQLPEKEAGTEIDFPTLGLFLASSMLQASYDNPESSKDLLPLIDNLLTLFEGRQKQTSQLSGQVFRSPEEDSSKETFRLLKSFRELILQAAKEFELNLPQEAEKKFLGQSSLPPSRSRLKMNFNEKTEEGGKNNG